MNKPLSRSNPGTLCALAVVVAGGQSARMGGSVKKPFLDLSGRTVLERSVAALAKASAVRGIVIVAHAEELERVENLRASSGGFEGVRAVVAGGATRTDSVRAGVRACLDLEPHADVVAVHDAARPFVQPDDVQRAIERAAECGASLLACPVADTIQRSVDGTTVESTLERSELWGAQTPQCFQLAPFAKLLERAQQEGLTPTDDAGLWRHYGGQVQLVESGPLNFKLTRPADLELARALMAAREAEEQR